jgi:SAM-dependent methyltransferase
MLFCALVREVSPILPRTLGTTTAINTVSVYEKTVDVYCTQLGAEAYVVKEMAHDAARTRAVSRLLDGVELEGKTFLDVGCGYGRDVARYLLQGADSYGCDVSPELLRMAEKLYAGLNGRLCVANVRDGLDVGAFPHSVFDIVWSCYVLVHVPREELADVLATLWSKVAAGGSLAIASKLGQGEIIMSNLGNAMPRVMVHYNVDDVVNILTGMGAQIALKYASEEWALPTGAGYFMVRAVKA